MKGKINPLIGFLTGESDSNTFTIVDCLECFAKCEYFDKIEEIVNTKTDGWDSIIREMAKTTHFSYHIPNIIDILLKSYFNHSSVEENKDMDKLRYYLQISKEKFKIRIKDFELDLSFLIADIDLTGYHCYRIYDHLEKQFHHYQEIAEVDANDILQIIKKGIEFFKKWKNGKIMLDDYIDNYVTNTAKKQELVNLRQKYKSSNSSDEVTKYSISISNIVETIENEALNIQ